MKLSQLRTIKDFCNDLFSTPDFREVVGELAQEYSDFTVDNVRFITADSIDSVLADELSGDSYVLGCFNASFIADVTGWPIVLIEAAQKGEAYSEIGQGLIDGGYVEEMAKQYASADGYGHHFNGYNGDMEELTIGETLYYVFDQH